MIIYVVINDHPIHKKETYRVGLNTPRRCDVASRILRLHSDSQEGQKKNFYARAFTFAPYIDGSGTEQDNGVMSTPLRAEAGGLPVECSHGKLLSIHVHADVNRHAILHLELHNSESRDDR